MFSAFFLPIWQGEVHCWVVIPDARVRAAEGAPQAGEGAGVCSLHISGISWAWDESKIN